MEIWIGVGALVVALVSVAVAFWQGSISKEQLRLARDTQGETKQTLDQIKEETAETRRISQDIKNNIDERITKILDNKLAAESQSQATGQAFTEMLMGQIAQSIQKKPEQ